MPLEALLLLPMPGALARWLLPVDPRRGVLAVLLASAAGWALSWAIFHEGLGAHALHPLAPEALLPSTLCAFAALGGFAAAQRRRRRRRGRFFASH